MKNRDYLILLALADSDLHGLGIARAVQTLSDGRTVLWPASLYGALEELSTSGRSRNSTIRAAGPPMPPRKSGSTG